MEDPMQPQPEAGYVITPAVTRPYFGSTLILAVPPGADEADVERLRDHLAASAPDDQVTVVAVRGIEALRTWEPEQPADQLAAAMAETRAALTDRDKYRNWLDDFTRVVLDVSDRMGLMRAAVSLRKKAGFEP